LLDEENAVERMDGWMEGWKIDKENAEDDFLLRAKIFCSTTKKGAKSKCRRRGRRNLYRVQLIESSYCKEPE
jgi:hypothetical protein